MTVKLAKRSTALSDQYSVRTASKKERGRPETIAALAKSEGSIKSHFRRILKKYVDRYYHNDEDAIWVFENMEIHIGFFVSNLAAAADLENYQIFINGDLYDNIPNKARFSKVVVHEFVHLVRQKKGLHKAEDGSPIDTHDPGFVKEMNRLGFESNVVIHNFKLKYVFRYKCSSCGYAEYHTVRKSLSDECGNIPCADCGDEHVSFRVVLVEFLERIAAYGKELNKE